MSRPSANIFLSNGNLGGQGASATGSCAVIVACAAAPVAGYGVAFLVKSIAQAKAAFIQAGNEDVVAAFEKGFFAEAPEGTELWCVAVVQTNTLTQMAVEAITGTALLAGSGNIRLVAVIKFPAGSYVPTIAEGFDDEVHTAATDMQTLADAWLAERKPFRAFLQGYGYDGIANNAKDYVAAAYPNVGIIVGDVDASTATATLLALGRASKVPPQRNIGRVKSGSLNISASSTVLIGATAVELVTNTDLDTLHDKRYITFERNVIAPGYIFNNDLMLAAPANDYSNLRNGRVIDNAVRVAYAAYYEELKDDVEVDENGRLAKVVEKALETKVETAIDAEMRGQLSTNADGTSAVQCLVNPDITQYAFLYSQNNIDSPNFNILQTNKVYLFVRMRPKGSLQYIDVYLGFATVT